MNPKNPAKVLLVKKDDGFWMHPLSEDQPPVHIAFMDATGKGQKEDYPILPLIAGGGAGSELDDLMQAAMSFANEYRAAGHLDKDFEIHRLRKQVPDESYINLEIPSFREK